MIKFNGKSIKKINSFQRIKRHFNDPMQTKAYPNYDYYIERKPARDVGKWVQAARQLYYQLHKGSNWQQAFDSVSNGWDRMEQLDFKQWLKFYEEGAQAKYKKAQMGMFGDQPGYYLPLQPQENKTPMPNFNLQNVQDPSQHPDLLQEQKRETIEKQRSKIISRLDSAEKLLRSSDGQMFAGKEFETLIQAIHELKRKILVINKVSTSVRLYQDLIIREANVLSGRGHRQASSFLVKIADAIPSVAEPPNPALVDGGQAGTIPGQSVGQVPPDNQPPTDISVDPTQQAAPPETPPAPTPPTEQPISPGMQEFLAGLDFDNEPIDPDNLEVNEADEDFIVEAQAIAPAPAEEVNEIPEQPVEEETPSSTNYEQIIDQSLANVNVQDVVSKLEDVAKIFKTREISRQLSIVDLMLDKLGLASLFPELNECIGKASEMSSYINSRVESIITKLRGTLKTNDIDLKNENAPPPNQIAQKLQETEEKEKAKKQMRKELEDKKLEAPSKPTPEVQMQEDLSQPTEVAPTPAPAPKV